MNMPAKQRLRRILVFLALVLAGTVACSIFFLGTPQGRQSLLDLVSDLTASPGFRLEMRGLRFGETWELDGLTISDTSGPWLNAKDITVRPLLGDLVTGRVTLDHLGVGFFSLERLPAGGGASGGGSVPRLRIRSIDAGHIRLGQGVAGHEALLSLHGGFELDAREARAALHVARLDREHDTLDLDGLVRLAQRTMDLRLDLREAPGGLLHTVLGVNGTEGIDLAVSGHGPFQDWPLTLDARVSDAARLAGNATLNLEGAPDMDLRARLTPGPAWTERTGLPGETVDIAARGSWRDPVLHLAGLQLTSGIADIEGNATWDSETSTLDAHLDGQGRDLTPFIPASVVAGSASVQASLRLDSAGLHSGLQARLQDWSVSGNAVASADADISLELPPGLNDWRAHARAGAMIPALPEGVRSWTANATLGGDFRSIGIDSLRLESEKLGIALGGRLDDTVALDAGIDLRRLPLGASQPGVSASLASKLRGTVDPGARSMSAGLDLNATRISGLPENILDLLGPDGRLTAAISISPESLEIREARLESRTTAEFRGTLDIGTQRFEAGFDARLPRLRKGGLNLRNGASLRGTAVGTPASFSANLVSESDGITAAGLDFEDIRAEAVLKGLPGLPAATVKARLTSAGQPASLDLAAAPAGKDMRISRALMELPGTTLAVTGDLNPGTLLLSGVADLHSQDLSGLGRMLGMDLRGELNLRANMTRDKGVQSARFEAEGRRISAWGADIGQAGLSGATAWPDTLAATDMRVDLADAAYGALHGDRIRGNVRGAGQGLGFELGVDDAASHTNMEAHGFFAAAPQRLRIDSLQGTLLKEKLRLDSPLDIAWSENGAGWQETALRYGPASLTSRGTVTPDGVDILAELRDMDPALLRQVLPNLPAAQVNARLHIQGTPQAPDVRLEAKADAIRISAAGLGNIPALGAEADVRLRPDLLEARASVASAQDIALDARISCPVRASLTSVEIPEDAPLSGWIKGHTELGILPRLLHLEDQAVAGKCELDFRFDGSRSTPRLAGSAQVRGGRYENFRSGTAVESADVDARATGTRIELNATATDGASGRAEGRGTVDLAALTYAFDVDVKAFRAIRLDLVQGDAAGPFSFRGDLDAAALAGNLTLDPATVNLPRSTAAEAPRIEINEINTGHATVRSGKKSSSFLIGMDLNVLIPARLTVRGRGLDSEWSGQLHVGGDHVRPAVSGEMNLLRGKFEFLDRNFDLTKGALILNGDTPPNPFLDMVGETRILDTLVQVHLNGPARNFRLSLTSVPALPQDELLAMVLFGRSMRDISPLQAVILAQAAAEMSGIGPDVDFLGTIKSRLGLQEVDVSKDENDETSVGIGGYVGGKYYIRSQRSVSGQDKTKVEVQLTPKISVETEIGADSRQGGGVNWKHDY